MSIIGIIWFTLGLATIIYFNAIDEALAAAGWGIICVLYGIPLSIVRLIYSNKLTKSTNIEYITELSRLNELKEKGVLTDDEFTDQKSKILAK